MDLTWGIILFSAVNNMEFNSRILIFIHLLCYFSIHCSNLLWYFFAQVFMENIFV